MLRGWGVRGGQRGMAEPVDDLAMPRSCRLPAGRQGGSQDPLDMPQVAHPLFDIGQAVFNDLLHVLA